PFNGIGTELAHGGRQLLDLNLRQAAKKEKRAEEMVELFEIMRIALQMEADFTLGTVPFEIVEPVERVLDGAVECLGGEWFDEIGIRPDLETMHFVFLVGQGSGHDDRDQVRFAVELERFADRIAVDVGQHQIQENHGGAIIAYPLNDVFAFEHDGRFKV